LIAFLWGGSPAPSQERGNQNATTQLRWRSIAVGLKKAGGGPLLRSAAQSRSYFASVLVVSLRTTPFYDVTHIVQDKDREGCHALPLFAQPSVGCLHLAHQRGGDVPL
jgi:hypothetical protein